MSSSNDFSLFSLFTAGLACLVPLANAYTQPVGASPSGNPIIEPGLHDVVPAGQNLTIKWEPTTTGNVDLVLLKGPASNAVPQYAIVENIPNSGSYIWTPSKDLAPSQNGEGYGIQLICDDNGQYQYSTQFGISNPDYNPNAPSTSSSASSLSAATGPSTSSPSAKTTSGAVYYTTEVVSNFTTYCPYATSVIVNNKTHTVSSATTLTISDCPCTITKPISTRAPITGTGAPSSGYLPANSSIVRPTGSMIVPVSLQSTASATAAATSSGSGSATSAQASPVQTGAAAGVATSFVGLVIAAGVAVFAL